MRAISGEVVSGRSLILYQVGPRLRESGWWLMLDPVGPRLLRSVDGAPGCEVWPAGMDAGRLADAVRPGLT